jgi:hypothetical protein
MSDILESEGGPYVSRLLYVCGSSHTIEAVHMNRFFVLPPGCGLQPLLSFRIVNPTQTLNQSLPLQAARRVFLGDNLKLAGAPEKLGTPAHSITSVIIAATPPLNKNPPLRSLLRVSVRTDALPTLQPRRQPRRTDSEPQSGSCCGRIGEGVGANADCVSTRNEGYSTVFRGRAWMWSMPAGQFSLPFTRSSSLRRPNAD